MGIHEIQDVLRFLGIMLTVIFSAFWRLMNMPVILKIQWL